jgi:hypothetical protein
LRLLAPGEVALDLVGIDPGKQWAVMRDLATYADGGPWDSLYAICYFPEAAYDRSGIELFEREVIPALR